MHTFLAMHETARCHCGVFGAVLLLLYGAVETRPALGAGDRPRPVVVVFFIGESDNHKNSEERFAVELELSLDRFEVRRVTLPAAAEFARAPMPERLRMIEDHSQRHNAIAMVWLEHDPDKRVLLNVVALSTGRALLRIVEAQRGPSAEAELALAAEELLGEAYLFESAFRDRAVADIVAKVKSSVAPVELQQDTAREPSPVLVGLVPFFRMGGGIPGQQEANVRTGGGFAVELQWNRGLLGRIGLSALAGPRERFVDGATSGICLSPELSAGYLWSVGPLYLGALAQLAFQWNRLDIILGQGGSRSFEWFGFRAAAGLEAQIPLSPKLSIAVEGLVGLLSQRRSFRRLSDRSMLIATPRADWSTVIGLLVWL